MAKKEKDQAELRPFKVVSSLHHDGEVVAVGDEVALSQAQFDALLIAGVVTGEWDAKAAKP